ncbi:MAG TPA: tetratricopeptide repeat protein [Paludibacter sp.]|nr:MAG: Tetratricopeptide repeat protein [Bacteroidetes bacterium ADurb.Bin174]HQB28612.1 tetratricopeptide repeat protein [Paludibacter sp.]
MRVLFLSISLFLIASIFSQSAQEASTLFNEQKYEESSKLYAALLAKRPKDALYNYRYARCNYETGNYELAIEHFITSGNRYPLRDFYLADSYFITYQFDEAIEYFTSYISSSTNEVFTRQAQDKLRQANIASRLIKRVEEVEIIDSIVVSKEDFLKHYQLSKETGQFSIQTVTAPNKKLIDLVTFITQRGDRKIFSDLVDNNARLFTANKLLIGWSKPEYLSKNIFSERDDNYPFLMLDGVTLYFASDNKNSIGGYDIFITRFNSNINDYLTPENIGMPFNSIYNDYMYVVDEAKNVGWFVTDRHQEADKVTVYQFKHRDEKVFVSAKDSDDLIQAAQLKTYKKGSAPVFVSEATQDIQEEPEDIQGDEIIFHVNDTLSYTNSRQFKSAQALKLWHEWNRISENLKKQEAALQSLRTEYLTIEDEKENKRLQTEILSLEKQLINTKLMYNEKIMNIRNEEIKYLRNIK